MMGRRHFLDSSMGFHDELNEKLTLGIMHIKKNFIIKV